MPLSAPVKRSCRTFSISIIPKLQEASRGSSPGRLSIDIVVIFFRLVKAGFSASRKQLINSISHGLDLHKADVQSLLEKAGIAPTRRAETLTLEEWARLWRIDREQVKA